MTKETNNNEAQATEEMLNIKGWLLAGVAGVFTVTLRAVLAALSFYLWDLRAGLFIITDTDSKDFTQLDAAIVEEIKAGNNTFTLLQQSRAAALAKPFVTPRGDVERVIDRRLQALRKKGAIRYSKGVWLDQCSKGGAL